MAETFVGTWKPDTSSMSGAQEYFAALGQPELLKEYEGVTETEVKLTGNTFTFVTRFENKDPRIDTVRIGESDEVSTPGGPTLVSKNRLEGDRLISDLYMGDKLLVNCVRVVEGGLMRYVDDVHSIVKSHAKRSDFKFPDSLFEEEEEAF